MNHDLTIGPSRRWGLRALAVVAALGLSGLGADLAAAQEESGRPEVAVSAGAAGVAAPAAQIAPTDQPSIVVSGAGEASGPAETAHVQLIVGRSLGPEFGMGMWAAASGGGTVIVQEDGTPEAGVEPAEPAPGVEPAVPEPGMVEVEAPPPLTEEDLTPIVDALVAAQIERDAIEVYLVPGTGEFGPGPGGVARIDATLEGPSREAVEAILAATNEAATEAGLSFMHIGVEYLIADCTALRREARADAIAAARDQATELADLLGVPLGEMLQAYDYGAAFGPGQSVDDPGCSSADDPFGSSSFGFGPGLEVTIPAYDPAIPLEAEVYASITMTFAVGDAA
jgi:hypothetical protein